MRLSRLVLLFVFVEVGTSSMLAQSPNGNINGLISDPASGAIVAAEIVAVNDVTGVQYTTKTNGEGIYVLPNLPPGPYRLQVSKIGFKTVIKPDIILNVQDALSVNFTLPIGAALESVTVEGGASMVNTTDASVSTVVDEAYVKNMPLNGRSFQDLILLTPGVVTRTPQATTRDGGEFSVNGQRTLTNYYTVDGVSADVGVASTGSALRTAGTLSGSVSGATALGTTQALVSVDALQEFRVQSSSYSAEYGRSPGGQFAFETKSGTNQWHGTASEYLRNGFFDAQDWFNNYFGNKSPAIRQNDFGGTFGGLVKVPGLYNGKDKTFFFVSYEGLRLTAPQAATAYFVPDASLRASAPAAVQPVLNAFPVQSPNGIDDTVNGVAQFIGTWSNPSSLDSTSARFDHVVNDKLRLFFRFSDTASSSAMRANGQLSETPSVQTISAYIMRTYTAGATTVFSNRLSDELRFNYSSNVTTEGHVIDPIGGSTPVDLRKLSGLGPGSNAWFNYDAGYNLNLLQRDLAGSQKQLNLVNGVNLLMGRHRLKFGVDYRRLAPSAVQSNPVFLYYYPGETDLLSNNALVFIQAIASAYPLYKNFSAFAQDEWRVSQRLGLSLGARWEVNPAPGITQGLMPYTFQGSGPDTWTLAPQGTPLWKTTWYNFAPRLGIAYIVHDAPGRETVLRGGGGVFFDTGQQAASFGFLGPGFVANNFFVAPFPVNATGNVPPIVNPPVPPYAAIPIGDAPHLQLPYTLGWNTSLEQAFGKSQAVTVSYVGSHGSRLLQLNSFQRPNTRTFLFLQNSQTSDYDSLQVQFRRRLTRGLTALASYTWSHCIDYGSQNFGSEYRRGNCDFDVRHNLSTAFSYDVPNIGHGGFMTSVLHHWGVDDRLTVRSSFPVTLPGRQALDTSTGKYTYFGLNLVPGQPIYLYGTNCTSVLQGLGDLAPGQGCPGDRAVNPDAFTAPTSCCGNAPRNFVRGFGAWQTDLAVRREFPIYENLKLQFRAEAFNIFNHPNFGTVNPSFGEKTFGQATGTLANSLGVLNPLYQMGGARSMQFALRLVF